MSSDATITHLQRSDTLDSLSQATANTSPSLLSTPRVYTLFPLSTSSTLHTHAAQSLLHAPTLNGQRKLSLLSTIEGSADLANAASPCVDHGRSSLINHPVHNNTLSLRANSSIVDTSTLLFAPQMSQTRATHLLYPNLNQHLVTQHAQPASLPSLLSPTIIPPPHISASSTLLKATLPSPRVSVEGNLFSANVATPTVISPFSADFSAYSSQQQHHHINSLSTRGYTLSPSIHPLLSPHPQQHYDQPKQQYYQPKQPGGMNVQLPMPLQPNQITVNNNNYRHLKHLQHLAFQSPVLHRTTGHSEVPLGHLVGPFTSPSSVTTPSSTIPTSSTLNVNGGQKCTWTTLTPSTTATMSTTTFNQPLQQQFRAASSTASPSISSISLSPSPPVMLSAHHLHQQQQEPPSLPSRYRVDVKIGSGSFGCVYAGTDIRSSDPVAIKFEKLDHPFTISSSNSFIPCPSPALSETNFFLAQHKLYQYTQYLQQKQKQNANGNTKPPPPVDNLPLGGLLTEEKDIILQLMGGVGIPTVKWFGTTVVPVPTSSSTLPTSSVAGILPPNPPSTLPPGLTSLHAPLSHQFSSSPNLPPSQINACSIQEQQRVYQSYRVLVLDLLGLNLQDLFELCDHKLSVKTVAMIADQLICRMEFIHSRGIIHRDLKPENFLIGLDSFAHIIYTIDFGLSLRNELDDKPSQTSRAVPSTLRGSAVRKVSAAANAAGARYHTHTANIGTLSQLSPNPVLQQPGIDMTTTSGANTSYVARHHHLLLHQQQRQQTQPVTGARTTVTGGIPLAKRTEKCIGTLRYMSRNSHKGIQQSRRDDLESLGYLLLYFACGYLPWQKKYLPVPATNTTTLPSNAQNKQQTTNPENDHKKLVLKCKESTPLHVLCNDLPIEFLEYMKYVRQLQYHDVPDYRYLRSLFERISQREGWSYDLVFDWTDKLRQTSSHHDSVSAPIAHPALVSPYTMGTGNMLNPSTTSYKDAAAGGMLPGPHTLATEGVNYNSAISPTHRANNIFDNHTLPQPLTHAVERYTDTVGLSPLDVGGLGYPQYTLSSGTQPVIHTIPAMSINNKTTVSYTPTGQITRGYFDVPTNLNAPAGYPLIPKSVVPSSPFAPPYVTSFFDNRPQLLKSSPQHLICQPPGLRAQTSMEPWYSSINAYPFTSATVKSTLPHDTQYTLPSLSGHHQLAQVSNATINPITSGSNMFIPSISTSASASMMAPPYNFIQPQWTEPLSTTSSTAPMPGLSYWLGTHINSPTL